MINLAVIQLKDIIKYLVRITIVVTVCVLLAKYFSSFKTQINIQNSSLLMCLDIVIPSIKTANKEYEEEQNNKSKTPLKVPLELELGMMDTIEGAENAVQEVSSSEVQENSENVIESEETANETNEEDLQEAETGLKTEVLENNVPEKFTTEYNGVKIRNETDNIKLTEDMLVPEVDVNMKNILIYHTHSCESYTPTENFEYKASGNFRTKDKNCSVIRVGTELKKYLTHYGYNVIHDTTIYDSSYSESYDRSLKGVAKLLEENEDTDILFDIHRDAIGDSSYAPTVKIGDEEAAQMMFVIGSNGGGSEHDNWNENLKLAIKIQEKANEMYPGLFKPIILRDSRYNQQLATGASIIEVGATGNTMEQCLASMKYLSKVLSEVLK